MNEWLVKSPLEYKDIQYALRFIVCCDSGVGWWMNWYFGCKYEILFILLCLQFSHTVWRFFSFLFSLLNTDYYYYFLFDTDTVATWYDFLWLSQAVNPGLKSRVQVLVSVLSHHSHVQYKMPAYWSHVPSSSRSCRLKRLWIRRGREKSSLINQG